MFPGSGEDISIKTTQKLGERLPQRVLYHRKAPFGLVYRGWAAMADLVRMPGFTDQASQILPYRLMFGVCKIIVVTSRQRFSNGVILLNQSATGHFGRVRSQYQFDIQRVDLLHYLLRAETFGLQAAEQFANTTHFKGQRFIHAAAANAVMLLGDIG